MSALSDFNRMFTVAKTLDSRALNLAGAQPFRALIARGLYNVRPRSHDPLIAELARPASWCARTSLCPMLSKI